MALIATWQEPFTSNTLPASMGVFGTGVTFSGGAMRLAPTTNGTGGGGFYANVAYDARDSWWTFQVLGTVAQSAGNEWEAWLETGADRVRVYQTGNDGTLKFQSFIGSTLQATAWSVAFSLTTHAWLRIQYNTALARWICEASPNGATGWVNPGGANVGLVNVGGLNPATVTPKGAANSFVATASPGAWVVDNIGLPPASTPPGVPTNLAGVPRADGFAVTLTWTRAAGSPTDNEIQCRVGGLSGSWFSIWDAIGDVTTFLDEGVLPGRTAEYRIRATNAGGASAYSSPITVAVPDVTPPTPTIYCSGTSTDSTGQGATQGAAVTWARGLALWLAGGPGTCLGIIGTVNQGGPVYVDTGGSVASWKCMRAVGAAGSATIDTGSTWPTANLQESLFGINQTAENVWFWGIDFKGNALCPNAIIGRGVDRIKIVDCFASGFGSGGFVTSWNNNAGARKHCDWWWFYRSVAWRGGDNPPTSWSSGFSVWGMDDNKPYSGAHNRIVNCVAGGWVDESTNASDGNGFIIDQPNQGGTVGLTIALRSPWTIVANCLSYHEGARDFHSLNGRRVIWLNCAGYKSSLDARVAGGTAGTNGMYAFETDSPAPAGLNDNIWAINCIGMGAGNGRAWSYQTGPVGGGARVTQADAGLRMRNNYYDHVLASPVVYLPASVLSDTTKIRRLNALWVNPPQPPATATPWTAAPNPRTLGTAFQLQATSPARGVGDDPTTFAGFMDGLPSTLRRDVAMAYAVDAKGVARPTSASDLGPYQYVPPSDTTAPVISAPGESAIATTSLVIAWATDEPADSQVQYGTTTGYGQQTVLDPALVTSHSVPITGLTPNTLYHYRILTRDAAGNLATGPDRTFTTLATLVAPTDLRVTAVTSSTAALAWTDANAGEVAWELEESEGAAPFSLRISLPANTTSYLVTGLIPDRTYRWRVRAVA